MAGLTSKGLTIKRLTEVTDDLRKEANSIFSDLVPEGDVLDTTSASTLGRLIGVSSPSEADLWEALQQIYLAFDPNSASGIALDNLVALAGIVRQSASSTTARVHLAGTYNITIPEDSLVSSSFTNVRFSIPSEVVLDENNLVALSIKVQAVQNSTLYTATYNDGVNSIDFNFTSSASATATEILEGLRDEINNNLGSILTATVVADTLEIATNDLVTTSSWTLSGNLSFFKSTKGITVVATETGPKEQPTGTIDTITTPVFGWDSVTQIATAIPGREKETDSMLRERFNDSKFTRGSNLSDSLFSDLTNLSGVDEVTVYENETDTVDANGIPAHAFMTLVNGGLEDEIAEVIWLNKPAGIATHGNTSVTIEDVQGNSKIVKFQRPAFVDIYVSVTITTFEDFPADGVEQIKSALFQYIQDNAEIGEDVIYSRLYTPINSVLGHQVDSLFIDTSPSPASTSNITIAFDEIAKLEIGNIEVTVT